MFSNSQKTASKMPNDTVTVLRFWPEFWFLALFTDWWQKYLRANRCRFAVELESLGVLCLLPAQATQVDNKEMLLHILYEKIRAFSGGEILEPKQTLVAGGSCSRRENCWQRNSPATCCSVWRSSLPPQKCEDVTVCGGEGSRNRLVLASNFFPDTKMTL